MIINKKKKKLQKNCLEKERPICLSTRPVSAGALPYGRTAPLVPDCSPRLLSLGDDWATAGAGALHQVSSSSSDPSPAPSTHQVCPLLLPYRCANPRT